MKKNKLMIILIISIILMIPTYNVEAKACKNITSKKTCQNSTNSKKCEWKNNKCQNKTTTTSTATQTELNCGKYTKQSDCPSSKGCVWGYNGSSTMSCYKINCSEFKTAATCSSDKGCAWSSNANGTMSCSNKKFYEDADSPVNFCAGTAKIWKVVGKIFTIFKILIPIILIIMGSVDFGKSAIASKDDEVKKAAKSLMIRAISGVAIFFIPTIVTIVVGLVVDFANSGAKSDYEICKKCILNYRGCDTSADASNK